MFLKMSQNSQENTYIRVFFSKVAEQRHRCFPVKFAEFLRTPFLEESYGRCLWRDIFLNVSPNFGIIPQFFYNSELYFSVLHFYNLGNICQVNNKDTRMTPMASF